MVNFEYVPPGDSEASGAPPQDTTVERKPEVDRIADAGSEPHT